MSRSVRFDEHHRFYLSVTTWAGFGFGIHYYGRISTPFFKVKPNKITGINFDKEEYDMENPVSKNKQFLKADDVVSEAVRWFGVRDGILYLGEPGICQPQKVLACSEKTLMKKENALFKRSIKCGGWELGRYEMKRICREWKNLWKAK